MEQEIVVLFHDDDEEGDEVFEVLAQLSAELRKRNVNKLVIGHINMNKNQPSEDFPVYQYPSLYLIYEKDGEMKSTKIVAGNKRELFH